MATHLHTIQAVLMVGGLALAYACALLNVPNALSVRLGGVHMVYRPLHLHGAYLCGADVGVHDHCANHPHPCQASGLSTLPSRPNDRRRVSRRSYPTIEGAGRVNMRSVCQLTLW